MAQNKAQILQSCIGPERWLFMKHREHDEVQHTLTYMNIDQALVKRLFVVAYPAAGPPDVR